MSQATSDTDEVRRASPRSRWRHPITVALGVAVVIGVLIVVALGVAFWRIYSDASIPSADQLRLSDPSVLLDADGDEVQNLRPAAIRENVILGDLPDHVPGAVLAAEDRDFEQHRGFSPTGIVRAALVNLRAGEVRQGASTINQQYVAMAVEDIDRSLAGKFREVATAARLDNELGKDEILEQYLNAVPFGRNAQGIQAASQTYFGVDAAALSVNQAATLAGMLAAPSAYDPARNPEGASQRRDFALRGMVVTGVTDEATADEHLGGELPELRTQPLVASGPEAYFLDAVRRQLPGLLEMDVADLDTGLRVHTTLDRRAQDVAAVALNDGLGDESYAGAVVTIESATGAYRALVGGRDYLEQQFDVASEGRRQVGSSFKTFALAELVAQGYDPTTTLIDAPEELEIEVEGGDDTTVRNFSGHGHGEVTVREATTSSINTAYMRMAEVLGYDRVVDRAARLGIVTELPPFPSMTLGAGDLRPTELTAAYATLAAEGVRRDPYLIERVETHDGEVLYDHEVGGEQVMDARDAAVVTDVLVDAVEDGTGSAADLDRPNAGKTGTTNAYRDAWFVGYTPEYATSVWVGNLDNTPMDEVTGGSFPARIWGAYMEELLEPLPVQSFPTADTSHLVPLEGLEAEDPEPEFEFTPPSEPEPLPDVQPPADAAEDTEEAEEAEEAEPEEADEAEAEEADEADPEEGDNGDGAPGGENGNGGNGNGQNGNGGNDDAGPPDSGDNGDGAPGGENGNGGNGNGVSGTGAPSGGNGNDTDRGNVSMQQQDDAGGVDEGGSDDASDEPDAPGG